MTHATYMSHPQYDAVLVKFVCAQKSEHSLAERVVTATDRASLQ